MEGGGYMRVYISGKIGELEPRPSTIEKFAKAEEKLRARGFDVFNPVREEMAKKAKALFRPEFAILHEGNFHKPGLYETVLLLDLDALSHCHAIYLLDDYKKSPGALTEASFAFATEKKCFFQDSYHASAYLHHEYNKLCDHGHPPLQREDGEDNYDLRDRYVRMHLGEIFIP